MFNQGKVHFFDPQSILCKFDGDREIEERKYLAIFSSLNPSWSCSILVMLDLYTLHMWGPDSIQVYN